MKLSSGENLGQQHQHEVLGTLLRNEGLPMDYILKSFETDLAWN